MMDGMESSGIGVWVAGIDGWGVVEGRSEMEVER